MRGIVGSACLLVGVLALIPRHAHGEFQVNAYTTSFQSPTGVAASAAGFVVVWNSYGQDGSGLGVFARRYDPMGVPLAGEFQVNQQTTGNQHEAGVAMDGSGAFVIVWSTATYQIVGRRYDVAGAPLSGEFSVNAFTTGAHSQPGIAMDASGDFVVVWSGDASGEQGRGIRGQRYDGSGVALGTEFAVNTFTTGPQVNPAVAMHPGGDFIVTWMSDFEEGVGNFGIFGRRYDASGAPQGGEFHVNTSTTGSQLYPSVAAEAGGGFVVVWQSYPDVVGQRYDGAGAPVGGEFVVNTYPTGGNNFPAVASDGVGFVVVWESAQEDFFTDVRGQRFDGAGQRLASEFQVNSYTTQGQADAHVAGIGAGDFVTVWRTATSSDDVAGQIDKPDRLIRGRRLRVSDRRASEASRSALLLGTESQTDVGPSIDGDPTVAGATLRIIANGTTDSDETFVLDAAGWRAASPSGFRYSGPTGGDGDPVRTVFLKRSSSGTALVKVVLRGSIGTQSLDVVPPNTGDDGGLVLDIGGGVGRYCVSFGGAAGGDEVQDSATGWKVVRATAEPGCPSP